MYKYTKEDRANSERYLYGKILTTATVLMTFIDKLIEIRAPDMLEKYRENDDINGLSAKYITEYMLKGLNEKGEVDEDLINKFMENMP